MSPSLASLAKSKHRTAAIGKIITAVQAGGLLNAVFSASQPTRFPSISDVKVFEREATVHQQTETATLSRTAALLSVNVCLDIICMLIVFEHARADPLHYTFQWDAHSWTHINASSRVHLRDCMCCGAVSYITETIVHACVKQPCMLAFIKVYW